MEDTLRHSIAPKDFPTATELALISSELAKGKDHSSPHQEIKQALALWESCFILLEKRKKDASRLASFIKKHQSLIDNVPAWPDKNNTIITFAKFSRLVRNDVSAKVFKESFEAFLFLNTFCPEWLEKNIYDNTAALIELDERKGTCRAKELASYMDQYKIASELEPICSCYLMIEAQQKKSGVVTELPVGIEPEIFSLENFAQTKSIFEEFTENGIRNDQYDTLGVFMHLWSKYYHLTRTHFNKSKSTLYRQS